MKVIIAGSRTITGYEYVKGLIEQCDIDITEVVSGGAKGVDKLGERWARENNKELSVFPADWERYKKAAGAIRNRQMAEYAEALIAVWDGDSKGTKNMIDVARDHKLQVFVFSMEFG
jgi:hypothetical protein